MPLGERYLLWDTDTGFDPTNSFEGSIGGADLSVSASPNTKEYWVTCSEQPFRSDNGNAGTFRATTEIIPLGSVVIVTSGGQGTINPFRGNNWDVRAGGHRITLTPITAAIGTSFLLRISYTSGDSTQYDDVVTDFTFNVVA